MGLRPGLLVRAAIAVLLAAAASTAGATYTTGSSPAMDHTATGALHAAADAARRAAGRETLFTRSAYVDAASKVAVALIQSQPVVLPGDHAPTAYYSGTTLPEFYDMTIEFAIETVVAQAHAVLAYPLHTDGGWSVVSKMRSDGLVGYGVALVVGWPDPAVPTGTGCSSSGYCWANGGLNPHLPWTRNVVTWYLSTSHLPSAGESLLKTAIANLDKVSRFGADLRYGGKTTDTGPTSAHRFVVVWGSCGTSSALACTTDGTQGTYRLVYQAKTVVGAARYAANPSTTWWVGTLMHEIGHGVGLGHFDGTYLGSYQLMRWADGPDVIKTGDANGLRRMAPAGRISATLKRSGTALVVTTANGGLGGIRKVTTQCTDAVGAWHTIASVHGTYDTRSTARRVGSYTPPAGTTRHCRAVVTSKTSSYTTVSITVTA
jgi:hypothetical protein